MSFLTLASHCWAAVRPARPAGSALTVPPYREAVDARVDAAWLSTVPQTFVLQHVVDKQLLYLCFVDLKAAYDERYQAALVSLLCRSESCT